MSWMTDFRKSINSMMDSIEGVIKEAEKMVEEVSSETARTFKTSGEVGDTANEKVVEEVEKRPDGTVIERKTTIRRSFTSQVSK